LARLLGGDSDGGAADNFGGHLVGTDKPTAGAEQRGVGREVFCKVSVANFYFYE
jgi:hypothetical protein